MFTLIKKHHRKAILSVPILFLLVGRGEVPPGNSLYLKPLTYFPEVGTPFSIELDFRSNVLVNASDGTIHFPTKSIYVDHLDTSKSIIDLWGANPDWSNSNGVITWSGGIIKPALNDGKQTGNIVRAVMNTTSAVPITLTIDDATLLASNGSGDNVLSATGNIKIYPRPKGMPSPDIDGDLNITARDVAQVVLAMGKKYNARYDLNNDGAINIKDVYIMLDYYNALRK